MKLPPLHRRAFPFGIAAALAAGPALALDPSQVFEKASPSVWVVRTYDGAERPVGQGSAVVIGPGRLVTNCHVLVKSKVVFVRRDNVMYQATLEHADAPRDMCVLQVANFNAPAAQTVKVGDLKVGQRVFAIGNPQGMEVTLSEGLISGLRGELPGLPVDQGGANVVQTTAPISAGSSGGGLFDIEGRLVGITTLIRRDAQNINIALPADWIADVPARAQAALAARTAPRAAGATAGAAAVPAGYPVPGTVWTYSFIEKLFSRRAIEVSVRLLGLNGSVVEEAVSAKTVGKDAKRVINVDATAFVPFPLDASNTMIEFAPYVAAMNDGKAPESISSAEGYPMGSATLPKWNVSVAVKGWESVSVAAGTYNALRVESEGRRSVGGRGGGFAGRFQMVAWYAPEVRRLVKLEQKVWSSDAYSPELVSDEVLELQAYRPPS